MKIVIEKLKIVNFKGIKDLEVTFNEITNIYGDNATGKTSVFDAFSWLVHGKNSFDQQTFGIKRRDKQGNNIEKVDVEVSAIISIDGKKTEIKKILHEVWSKKRGEPTPSFVRNENLYFWNDVPLQLQQFQEKINAIIDENIFKLITNTLYYNSLPWQRRREILLEIGGEPTNEEMIDINPDFKGLVEMLGDKKFTEFKAELAVKKKKLKDALSTIPARIDEVNHGKPEEKDWSELKSELEAITEQLNAVELSIQDANKALTASNELYRQKQNSIHRIETDIQNITNDIRNKFSQKSIEKKNKIADLERNISSLLNEKKFKFQNIDHLNNNLSALEKDRAELGALWDEENSKQIKFDDKEFKCPTCGEPFKADKVEDKKKELTENFNKNKATQLQRINSNGSKLKERIEKITEELQSEQKSVKELEAKISSQESSLNILKAEHRAFLINSEDEFKKELESNAELTEKRKAVASLQEELANTNQDTADNSELIQQKNSLREKIDQLKKQLIDEEQIKKCDQRLQELADEEAKYSQQLLELEGKEFQAEQFNKAKMETLVNRVNSRFKYVTFKMFEQQINGGEKECCETLVPGPVGLVPFSDANNAAKINAGLDIINTLCHHYQVYAPIFIDNRESVNKLIDCNSQIINLIVSNDQKLKIA